MAVSSYFAQVCSLNQFKERVFNCTDAHSMNSEPLSALHAAALQALAQVDDPEMGENLVDLGVVGEVRVDGDTVTVRLIPTSATCPMADVMVDDAQAAVQRACPPGTTVDVFMDWDTPWSPERLAPELKARFGW